MFTLAFKLIKRERTPLGWVLACLVGGAVYQTFGRGVTSLAMSLCFIPPLVYALLEGSGALESLWAKRLLGASAATLAAGLFLQGILEIAGTDSPYLSGFYGLGAAEALAGAAAALITAKKGGVKP